MTVLILLFSKKNLKTILNIKESDKNSYLWPLKLCLIFICDLKNIFKDRSSEKEKDVDDNNDDDETQIFRGMLLAILKLQKHTDSA